MSNILNYSRKTLSDAAKILRAVLALRGKPNGLVGTDSDGFATLTHLGSGTPSGATVLKGDGTWAAVAGTGDVVGDDVATTVQNIVAYNAVGGKNITELTGTQGDVLYHNGTNWAKLAAGTSGDFLKTNGAGANPAWATAAGGASAGFDVDGGEPRTLMNIYDAQVGAASLDGGTP